MREGPGLGFANRWVDLSGTGCQVKLGWKRVQNVHILDSGLTKRYHKGFILDAELRWAGSSGITEALMPSLMELFNEPIDGEPMWFGPFTNVYAEAIYKVIWDNDWELYHIQGLAGRLSQGTIKLIGAEVLSQALYLNQGQPRDP